MSQWQGGQSEVLTHILLAHCGTVEAYIRIRKGIKVLTTCILANVYL
jgi:hypothetical protein